MKSQIFRRAGQFAFALIALTALGSAAQAQLQTPKFVKLAATPPATVVPGKAFALTLNVSIDKPYHVQANPATEGYIPTEIKIGTVKGFTAGKAVYPKGMEAVFSGDKLSVYEGLVKVTIPVTAASSLKPGKYTLPLTLHFQGCNERACFPPADTTANVVITVGGGGVKATPLKKVPAAKATTKS